ncbi:hypothetical protein OIU84_003924 [Salix udensis]|uniref:Uncharacterized protein n=1 Tax=Salix udensis TaxID=889485 RepID=A0AAD6K219_9ROSI|nr:hypothetical protein OIU84_003924 [Salix udensis]
MEFFLGCLGISASGFTVTSKAVDAEQSFAVVNSLPLYEAIALRNDSGKMPIKTTITATLLAGAVYAASSFIFM